MHGACIEHVPDARAAAAAVLVVRVHVRAVGVGAARRAGRRYGRRGRLTGAEPCVREAVSFRPEPRGPVDGAVPLRLVVVPATQALGHQDRLAADRDEVLHVDVTPRDGLLAKLQQRCGQARRVLAAATARIPATEAPQAHAA